MGVLLLAAGGWCALSQPAPDASAAALVRHAKLPQTAPSAAQQAPAAALANDHRAALPAVTDSFLTEHLQQTFEDMLLEATVNKESGELQDVAVQTQTAGFDSRNTSARERHAQRSAQYGEPAASRLAQLHGQDRQWQNNLDQYAQATAAQRRQLDQLRKQLFAPEQQQRADAGLELRALSRQASKN